LFEISTKLINKYSTIFTSTSWIEKITGTTTVVEIVNVYDISVLLSMLARTSIQLRVQSSLLFCCRLLQDDPVRSTKSILIFFWHALRTWRETTRGEGYILDQYDFSIITWKIEQRMHDDIYS
jgi:hypothetical protein